MKPNVEVVVYDIRKDDYRSVANYDQRRYRGSANEYKRQVTSNAYKKLIGPLEGKRILDVGCGTGRGLADFAGEASLAIGTDASRDMLMAAARKVADKSGVGLVRSYAQQLPFSDRYFDVVTALNFLHLFSLGTQRQMVAEMKRVVRPGGMVILEFDNALHGLGIGLYKRWAGRERGSLPQEIRWVVGDKCQVAQIHGAVFPVVWRLFHHVPRVFTTLEKIAYYPPLNRVAHRIFYKLIVGESR
jgi:ubiquinone/menaquinone biosynthesis C-methylase UbiE